MIQRFMVVVSFGKNIIICLKNEEIVMIKDKDKRFLFEYEWKKKPFNYRMEHKYQKDIAFSWFRIGLQDRLTLEELKSKLRGGFSDEK